MSGKALLRIPANRHPAAGDASIASPWYGPSRLSDRPFIATFVGTDESFVDAFFRGVEDSGGGFRAGAFPRLFPARDFSEPPRALMNGAGEPSYFREHVEPLPEERPSEGELELDGKGSFAGALIDAGVGKTEAEVSDKVFPDGDQPRSGWLRKLYLPMHTHFHMVACDLVCHRPGFPRIDRKRVIEAGMVIRRFLPDTSTDAAGNPKPARWQDWIVSPLGGGIWVDIADESMKALSGGTLLDPASITRDLLGSKEVDVLGRLGIDITKDPSPVLGLGLSPLAALPSKIEESLKHTSRYGFLPIAMGDKERGEAEPSATPEEIGEAFAEVAEKHLQAQVLDHADAIRKRVRDALLPLFKRLWGTLPDRPSQTEVQNATSAIQALADAAAADPDLGDPEVDKAAIDEIADKLGLAVFTRYQDLNLSKEVNKDDDPWLVAMDNVVPLLPAAGPADLAPLYTDDNPPKLVPPTGARWLAYKVENNTTHFDIVMREALWKGFATQLLPSGDLVPDLDPRYLVALLQWIRRRRVLLLDAFYTVAFTEMGLSAPEPDKFLPNPVIGAEPLRVPMTVGALGAEVSTWLAAERLRGKEPVAWRSPTPPDGLTQEGIDIHEEALVLEQALGDVDIQGAGAGGAYVEEINELARVTIGTLHKLLGQIQLLEHGFELRALPERGLFLFPTPSSKPDLNDFLENVKARYTDPAKTTSDKIQVVAKARRQVVRARFDADNLYAVWCYARVASRDPCETPQLVWSKRTEVFSLAEPMDLLGLKPVSIRLPDLPKLLRDMPRMKQARALPFAAIAIPQDSGVKTGDDPKQTQREWGIAWICSFAIPVFTICAWVMFSIIFSILLLLPGFAWLLLLKFCIPVPAPKKS